MFKLFKGFILVAALVLIITFSNKASASSTYFVWKKTEINVPVFSSLEEYKDDFIVEFYENGKQSKNFIVEYETNCSTFSTVLTNKLGRYTVYYKAYSTTENNRISSEQAIIFNVIDVKAPIISLNSSVIEVSYGLTLKDFNWYSITDDTCSISEIQIDIDDSNIIYDALGMYNATIKATDLYNNSNEVNFNVRIIDNINPEITVLKPLIFNYGEKVKIEEYFKCIDNYDKDITNLLLITDLDTNTIGRKQIKLCVSDYSNNTLEMLLEINVIDKTPPVLVLIETETTLDIVNYNSYDNSFFEEYIYSVYDNYSSKSNIKIEINSEELVEEIADYNVYYTVIDENNNKNEYSLLVKLREFIGPEIIVDEEINLELGEEIDLLSLVQIVDKYDLKAYERLSIESNNLDINKAGTYNVKYVCFNISGIYTEKTITINVIDKNNDIPTSTNSSSEIIICSVIVGSIGIASFIALIIIKRKRKNK